MYSALAIQQGALQSTPISSIVPESVLTAAVKVPVTSTVTSLDHLIADFRESLKAHGARGLTGISRVFRIADADDSGSLDFTEFSTSVAQHTLHWSPAQVKSVFDSFDNNKDGKISHTEFVNAVRGVMNERRQQIALVAFQLLDKDKSGTVELKDLIGTYDATKHPDVISGKRAPEDVLRWVWSMVCRVWLTGAD